MRETRVWQKVGRHPLLCDAALAVSLAGLALLARRVGPPHGEPLGGLDTAGLVALLVSLVAVAFRRLRTRTALVAAALAWVGLAAAQQDREPSLMVALVLLFFTHAGRADRRTAWLTAGGFGLVFYLVGAGWTDGGWLAPENVGLLAWIGMATAVGDATRSRRAYVAEVEERARRAEQSRDEEARRRVFEERLRIARELHDVVAHHIAVIKVQATGAKHVLERRPELVAPALDHISRSSDAVLKEIASVVGLLRSPDDLGGDDSPETEPTRGLARLSGLLDDMAAAGLRVGHHQAGVARELPALVDLAAFRIAQEALTNAQKYGDGTARLTVAYTADGVTLEVTNPVRPDALTNGWGYGIIGMRERAASTGGRLTAEPTPYGHFTVRAELPTTQRKSADRSSPVRPGRDGSSEERTSAERSSAEQPSAERVGS